jgi:hypothetical protein
VGTLVATFTEGAGWQDTPGEDPQGSTF